MNPNKWRKARAKKSTLNDGFVLPLIIIVGLIIGTGLMALSARTFSGLIGSIRQGQSREAREAAESGMALILKELNRGYPYLLIEDCDVVSRYGTAVCSGWMEKGSTAAPTDQNGENLAPVSGTFSYRTSICPRSDAPPETIFSKLSNNLAGGKSRYRLLSYDFTGDQHQGGHARLRVLGERLLPDGSTVKATALINREVVIRPKNCDVPVGTASEASGFPGILGESVNLGNSDTVGSVNGNVLCTGCDPNDTSTDLATQVNLKDNQGFVEGEIFGGKIGMPVIPDFPCSGEQVTKTGADLDILEPMTLSANFSNNGRCCTVETKVKQYDDEGNVVIDPDTNEPDYRTINVTHCKANNITLNGAGQVLEISTSTNNHLSLYVSGDINISGAGNNPPSIQHSGNPADFAIFGKPRSNASTPTQTVDLNGGPQALNLFIYMPEAKVSINGGSSTPDVIGAIWAREYAAKSNVAEILIPDDMGSMVWANYGSGFDLGIREYAALGTTDWSIVQPPAP